MPAEWEKHEATWIAWPHNKEHWPGNFKPIPYIFAEIAKNIADSEKTYICVNNQKMAENAKKILIELKTSKKQFANINFFNIPTNTSWTRDFGPIFVRNNKNNLIITDWIFNSWGNKYPPFNLDDIVPQKIGKILNLPIIQTKIILEGGSIDVNGKGTLLTTSQCLLNKNRNSKLTKKQIENYLKEYLGATNILWLKEGIIGDDTDGHIDDIARFVNQNTIVCALEENVHDENYQILKKNYIDLKKMKDQDGKPFKIITLPMPDPVIYKNQRLPASYLNFLITNKSMLVPIFRCSKDKKILQIITDLFPQKKIIGIDCVDLIWGLGAIHCSTQQQPKK